MTDTVTLPRTVVEQALEAFDKIAWSNDTRWQSDRADDARIVLRAALEQPQPPRKPLTDDERQDVYAKAIKAINNDPHLSWRDAIVFETERAHGIGGDA